MQKLLPGKVWRARWGGYSITIDLREPAAKARLDLEEPEDQSFVVFMSEQPVRTMEEAILWAGEKLWHRGCYAVIDGEKRTLEAFLVFAEVVEGAACSECAHPIDEHKEARCWCDRTTPDENGCLAHADPAKGLPNRPCTHKNCRCENLNGPATPYKRDWR